MIDAEIEELEVKLTAARRQKAEELAARRKTVTARYEFSILPKERSYQQLADPSCAWYELRGVVINREEVEAVGSRVFEGGMDYLFNRLSGRFVISSGGGSVFLRLTGECGRKPDIQAWTEIEKFIGEFPDGGDVTAIVDRYRRR